MRHRPGPAAVADGVAVDGVAVDEVEGSVVDDAGAATVPGVTASSDDEEHPAATATVRITRAGTVHRMRRR